MRRSFLRRAHQPVLQHAGIQKCSEQSQKPRILNPFGDTPHQDVVVDPIEELFEVEIHDPAVTLGYVALGGRHRLMRRSSGSEPEAGRGERLIPAALQHLQHRLLNKAVQSGRNAKLAHSTVRLGDFHMLHRLRCIGAVQELLSNGWPVLPQVVRQVTDGHTVDTWGTLVGLNSP